MIGVELLELLTAVITFTAVPGLLIFIAGLCVEALDAMDRMEREHRGKRG